MQFPFWRRRPTDLVVTFTQEIDFDALAAGTPGVFGDGVDLAIGITCNCGTTMGSNYPFVVTRPNSVTRAHACPECGSKVNIIYTYDVASVEPPFDWARTDEQVADGSFADPAWREVSRASSAVREALGLVLSMREARDVPHPFVPAKGEPYDSVHDGYLAQYCAACGCIRSMIAHKESWGAA